MKESDIIVIANKPSKEALKNFAQKVMAMYNETVARENMATNKEEKVS